MIIDRIVGLTVAFMVSAASWHAIGQVSNCRPTADALAWLSANGWRYHDALVSPPGVAVTLYCRDEAGLLVGHGPDGGVSCLITSFAHGCVIIPEPGAES